MIVHLKASESATLEVPKGVASPARWEVWPAIVKLAPSLDRRSCVVEAPMPGVKLGMGRCCVSAYDPAGIALGHFYLKVLAGTPSDAQKTAPDGSEISLPS